MINIDQSISEIVKQHYQAADVFTRHGISYCCGGNVSLKQACELANLDSDSIINEIEQASRPIRIPGNTPFHSWSLAFMIDYIINVHHSYTREMLPRTEASLITFHDGHQKKHPETGEIIDVIQKINAIISAEIKQEEEILFPYIKQLEFINQHNEPYGPLFVKTLRKPINKLDKNNSSLQELLGKLHELTNGFRFPGNACTRMQVLYNQLKETHDNIREHKHMENNFLFPAASRIETELMEK